MPNALGIDVGTSNAKAVLVDGQGRIVASASRPLRIDREGERAEQDAEAVWSAVVAAVRELTEAHPAVAAEVGAVGVCSQYSSIVAVDAAANPVAPMRLYLDGRGTARSRAIMAALPQARDLWAEHHGVPPFGGGLSLGHMLHLQLDCPEVHAATTAWLEPMDFVTARLTGRTTATRCSMFAAQLCDNRSEVAAYDHALVELSGIDPTRLPPLMADDAVVGQLSHGVAAQVGLPVGAIVAAGMNDSQAGALATGAVQPDRVGLVVGTTAVLLATVDHMVPLGGGGLATMPSPVPGRHLVWAENGMAGQAVDHVFTRMLDAGFDELESALADSSPGASGVVFHPWLNGSQSPNPDTYMRGGFLNLSLDTRRADLLRAAVEGTAHNLVALLAAVEDATGEQESEIAFAGGAARSPGWAQAMADILDRRVLALADPSHACARAVALDALRRVGAQPPLADAQAIAAFEPDPSTRSTYEKAQSYFAATFTALRPAARACHGR